MKQRNFSPRSFGLSLGFFFIFCFATLLQAAAPTFTNLDGLSNLGPSVYAKSHPENSTVVYDFDATSDGENFGFSISGTDSARFSINTSSGVLSFSSAPDYENPQDSNHDNSYAVYVTVEGLISGERTTIDLRVNVSNVNEFAPLITSTPVTAVNEDSPYGYILSATDGDHNSLAWGVKSGTSLPDWLTLRSDFQTVGSAGFSADAAYDTSIAIDGSGTPYVVYQDEGNGYKVTVMKYNGSSWVGVGNAGFSAGVAEYTSIAINGSGTPYVVYQDGGNGSRATVMKFNGNSWVNVGSVGFSAGPALYTSIAIDGSGTPYVVYQDVANGYKATVMKFNGSSWVGVGSAGFSAGAAYDTSIAIDGSGTPYVVYKDGGNSNRATVMKFNGSSWVNVGSVGFSADAVSYTSIAINGSGTPYVVYMDFGNGNKATVMKYNGSSWVNVGSAGFSAGAAAYPSIAINGSGTPYVVYKDGVKSSRATVMKFNGSSWVNVGSAGFSAGAADYTSIAIDGNDTPYVVYMDGGNSYKATVKRFETSLKGTPTEDDVGVHDINLTVSDDAHTAEHNFQITVANVNDAPVDISLSSSTINENRPSGTTVGILSVVDEDAGDTHTFSLDCSADGTPFVIAGTTLQSAVTFDSAIKSSYNLCVRVRDSGGVMLDKNFTISVTVADSVDHWPSDTRFAQDSDNDGLPDEWEIFQYGNLATASATSDVDGDGYTDVQEFSLFLSTADPYAAPNAPDDGSYDEGFSDGNTTGYTLGRTEAIDDCKAYPEGCGIKPKAVVIPMF